MPWTVSEAPGKREIVDDKCKFPEIVTGVEMKVGSVTKVVVRFADAKEATGALVIFVDVVVGEFVVVEIATGTGIVSPVKL